MQRAALAVGLAAILSSGACKREPSFEDRFEKTQGEIAKKAADLEGDLERSEKAAAEAESAAGIAPPEVPNTSEDTPDSAQ